MEVFDGLVLQDVDNQCEALLQISFHGIRDELQLAVCCQRLYPVRPRRHRREGILVPSAIRPVVPDGVYIPVLRKGLGARARGYKVWLSRRKRISRAEGFGIQGLVVRGSK